MARSRAKCRCYLGLNEPHLTLLVFAFGTSGAFEPPHLPLTSVGASASRTEVFVPNHQIQIAPNRFPACSSAPFLLYSSAQSAVTGQRA